ncbi:hypothetical protein J3459_015760 [Metarhizium acridum]|nr:hypothetical protein J3459_015760 [Metarhizium acridum]
MSCHHHPITYPGLDLNLFDDDEARWRAVQTRDAVADGCFVYAVKTTKNAGFRACKRCKPEMEGFMPEERAVQWIRKFVLERAGTAAEEKGVEPEPDGQEVGSVQVALSQGV